MADRYSDRWRVLALMVQILLLTLMTSAKRTENCDTFPALDNPHKVDVHCNCMQRLFHTNLSISQLTINQTSCFEKGLELNWPDLETMVAPDTLLLVGAQVFFANNIVANWNSSISRLSFFDSTFDLLPAHVFKGMKLLKQIRIFGGSVGIIKSNAFSNLDQLQLVEIANTSISMIESHAFSNLSSLEDLAIVYTSVGTIETEAVSLNRETIEEINCADIRVSASNSKNVIDVIGRQITSTANVSLPEFGTRLYLFKNNIQSLKTRALATHTLGFLIVGGNHFENVESLAFSMELYNGCEISAALFIGNTITNLQRHALRGLTGSDGVPYQTFIALSNNKFHKVEEQGFRLNKNVIIYSADENHFDCTCDALDWLQSNNDSQEEQELEKELVLKAICLDGTNLVSFATACTDHGTDTKITPDTHPPVPPTQSSGVSGHIQSTFSATFSILTLVISRSLI
ncbi:P-granule-associated novel protein 1 [Cherax quadricarinatus]|uniref:P-granule-associated novel protein 1 n=1 Tax=Cherax quadricarinatus TaxID=27406 RepID=UPI00387E5DA4